MQLESVGGHADGAGVDAFGHEVAHARDVVVGRGLVGRTALPHHVGAHRAVRHLHRDVEGARDAVERVHVLGNRLPVPRDRFPQAGTGDALDAFHQSDEPVVAVGGSGRETDTAVAHDHGGDAVPQRRREQRVPRDLAVVVGVHVDEAGRDDEAGGVELFSTRLVDGADGGDAAVVDGDVGEHGGSPATVDHRSVADHEIVHVAFPPKGRHPEAARRPYCRTAGRYLPRFVGASVPRGTYVYVPRTLRRIGSQGGWDDELGGVGGCRAS